MEKIERENKLEKLLKIEDAKELYAFLQKNGYTKSESEFKTEIEALIEENPINLEDSELDSVAGGSLKDNMTKIASAGMASLMMLGASPLSSQVHAGNFVSTPTKQLKNFSTIQASLKKKFLSLKNNPNAKKIILASLGIGGAGTAAVGIGGLTAYFIYRNHKKAQAKKPQTPSPTQQAPKGPLASTVSMNPVPQQQVTNSHEDKNLTVVQDKPEVISDTSVHPTPDSGKKNSIPTPQPSPESSPVVTETPSPSQSPDLMHETTHSSDDDNDKNNLISTEQKEDITDNAQQTTSTHSDDVDQLSSSFSASTSHSGVPEESPDHTSKQETNKENVPQQPQQNPSNYTLPPIPPSAVQPSAFTPIKFNPQYSTLAPPKISSFPSHPSYKPLSTQRFSTTTTNFVPPPLKQSMPLPLDSKLPILPHTLQSRVRVQSNNDQKTQPSGSLPSYYENRSTVANKAANTPPSPVAGMIPKKEQVSREEIEKLQIEIAEFNEQIDSDSDSIQEFYNLDSVNNFKQNVKELNDEQVDSSNYKEIEEEFESLKSQYGDVKNTISEAQYIKDHLWKEEGYYNLNDEELNEVCKMTEHIEELLDCRNLRDLFPENILNGDECDECNLNNCYCYLCFAVCTYLRSNYEWLGDLDSSENHFINKNSLRDLLSSCNKCLNRLMIVSALTNNESDKTKADKCIKYLKNKLPTIKELDNFENSVSGDDISLFTSDDINVLHELVSNGENLESAIFNRSNNDFKYLNSLLKGFKNHCGGTVNWSNLKIKAYSAPNVPVPNSTAMPILEYLKDSGKTLSNVTIVADGEEF